MLFDVETPEHRDEHVATLNRHRADGLIVMSMPLPVSDLDRISATGVSIVLVDAHQEGYTSVHTDDVAGGELATRHLVELGHRRIGFMGDSPDNPFDFTSSRDREAGYRRALDAADIPVDDSLVRHGAHQHDVGADLAEQLLSGPEPPTALVCCSDVQAAGAMERTRRMGLSVPGDVSIVGFDDIEMAVHLGLTTVRQPLYRSGELGMLLLLEALGAEPPAPTVHELDLELVPRASTAPPHTTRGEI